MVKDGRDDPIDGNEKELSHGRRRKTSKLNSLVPRKTTGLYDEVNLKLQTPGQNRSERPSIDSELGRRTKWGERRASNNPHGIMENRARIRRNSGKVNIDYCPNATFRNVDRWGKAIGVEW
ncbi:hypothetical protein NPIL_628581 [Nephila pilipes]|uniref:Uncharacterized protein n=1 Tax=Nephila pilipes TaxID=299642 RepID=A0A8X6Q7I1_NEPPI|nr:hypothetical protein NPIL_628581 [Nephila pilipes]